MSDATMSGATKSGPMPFSRPGPIIELDGVVKAYPLNRPLGAMLAFQPRPMLQAVSEVSLAIETGETFGLVGKSGCGKSTLGRLIVGLGAPDRGRITFRDKDILPGSRRELRALRRQIQMVFQDPYASLDPRMTIGQALAEPLRVHRVVPAGEVAAEVDRLLAQVGLSAGYVQRYPFELSGGQRQRVAIARALSVRPAVLVADEAVSGLDVSIQAQVLNLLVELRDRLGLTMVFISHDLGVVEYLQHPHRCHVSRQDPRVRARFGRVPPGGASLYPGPDPGHPGAGPGPQDHARGGERRPAEPGQPAQRLRLSHPLPQGPGHLRHHAAAGDPRPRSLGGLPFRHRAGAVAGPPRRQFIALNGHRNEGIEE